MTVSELITVLQELPSDSLVVQAKDAEGNNFSPVSEVSFGRYEPATTWHGQFGLYELTDQLRAQGFDIEDVPAGSPAACIWPVR